MAGSRQFTLALAKWAAKAGGNADLAVKRAAITFTERVVLRSPVDTGRFRANWQLTIGSPAASPVPNVDKSGSATLAQAQNALGAYRSGQSIWIANALPYAVPLEMGWSAQAPRGMLGVTVQEFDAIVNDSTKGLK